MFEELLLAHSGDARRPIMTIFEQYQQEKREQFMVGVQQEKHAIARKLLMKGLVEQLVAETTELSVTEVKKLKKELEDQDTKH